MNQLLINEENLLRYGIDSDLANKAAVNLLTLTKIRSLLISDITHKFLMSEAEAHELEKCVLRQPIGTQVIGQLLNASNFTCSVCKGVKSHAYVIHHIEPYELTQDNSYENLIVLCPSDHDLAHRVGSLTLSISKQQLIAAKLEWESQVERLNPEMASRTINLEATMGGHSNDNGDEKTLRYLMNFIRFTSLASDIYYLSKSFNINFLDVATMMDALMHDRPHGYPFTDQLLQHAYGEYLENYYALLRLIVGETREVPHFSSIDDGRSQCIAERNGANFSYQENVSIDQAIEGAKQEFERSYRNLISFLREHYPKVRLDAYNEF